MFNVLYIYNHRGRKAVALKNPTSPASNEQLWLVTDQRMSFSNRGLNTLLFVRAVQSMISGTRDIIILICLYRNTALLPKKPRWMRIVQHNQTPVIICKDPLKILDFCRTRLRLLLTYLPVGVACDLNRSPKLTFFASLELLMIVDHNFFLRRLSASFSIYPNSSLAIFICMPFCSKQKRAGDELDSNVRL